MNNLKVFDNSTEIQGILKIVFKNNSFNKKKNKNRRSRKKEVAAMENNQNHGNQLPQPIFGTLFGWLTS